jgi:hypothetical protein
MTNVSVMLDEDTRERLRAVCHEYKCSIAHVFRQLVCAEFRQLFPDEVQPQPRPLRRLDRDRGPKRALYPRSAESSSGIVAADASSPLAPPAETAETAAPVPDPDDS